MTIKKTLEILINNTLFGEDILPYLLEIKLINGNDSFLKSIETLQRIGYSNNSKKELFQLCHILHKRNKYYIVHFKSLNLLDGCENLLTKDDILIQNSVALLLEQWGMIKILNADQIGEDFSSIGQFKILSHKERKNWKLIPNYIMNNKRKSIL